MSPAQKAAETRARNKASKVRMDAIRAETIRIVATGTCPQCAAGIRRNSALRGWVQCDQFGSDGFRKDSTKPACSWQGFTE